MYSLTASIFSICVPHGHGVSAGEATIPLLAQTPAVTRRSTLPRFTGLKGPTQVTVTIRIPSVHLSLSLSFLGILLTTAHASHRPWDTAVLTMLDF